MGYCAVLGCNSNTKMKSKEIHFYRFPKDANLNKQWLNACKRQDKFNVDTSRICSLHFSKNDEQFNLKHDLLKYSPSNARKLKSNAIPHLNLPNDCKSIEQEPSKSRQVAKRRNIQPKPELLSTLQAKPIQENEYNIEFVKMEIDDSIISNVDVQGNQSIIENQDIKVENHVISNIDSFNDKQDVELLELRQKCQLLQEKNEFLQTENLRLQNELKSLKSDAEKFKSLQVELNKFMTVGQIKCIMNRGKRIKWTHKDISMAISLNAVSARCYRYLKNTIKYPLPAISTLSQWIRKINCGTGIMHSIIKLMASKNANELEKLTVLSFDEMKVMGKICSDQNNDSIMGNGNYVQVAMARGLIGNWKQPVYYNFDTKMTKSNLFEIIKILESNGYRVVAIVNDLGVTNVSLWNELGISIDKVCFPHPYCENKFIYTFADVPHMVKLARNHLLDTGYIFNNEIFNAQPLYDLLEINADTELKIAHKLTLHHLIIKGPQRRKVKYATQLLSNTNAKALLWGAEKGMITSKNWNLTSDFLKRFNDWFDICNVRNPEPDSREGMHAYGLHIDAQKKILTDMIEYISNIRTNSKRKSFLPFQKGIIVTSKAIQELYEYLKKEYDIKYILTYRLNQDVLENFFSTMKSAGGLHEHPTPAEFMQHMKKYLLGRNNTTIAQNSNTLQDATEQMDIKKELRSLSKEVSIPDVTISDPVSTISSDLLRNLKGIGKDDDRQEETDNVITVDNGINNA